MLHVTRNDKSMLMQLLGCIILFTSLLGCAGAKYYSRLFLALYILCVVALFICQLAVAAMISTDASAMTGLGVEEQQQADLTELFNESSQAVRRSLPLLASSRHQT